MINKCGFYCTECYAYHNECAGCEELEGTPFWTEHIGGGQCPVYKCCQEKEYQHCGDCAEIPCKTWYDFKDPSITEEEHLNSIKMRTKRLQEETL
jgi:hypothetical protein